MTAIIDYGVGNLFSLRSSLRFVGEDAVITGDEKILSDCERIILPGVGAFGDAAAKLRGRGLDVAVRREAQKGKPLLGICLGMQLLFEKGYEYGEHTGLGLIPGSVRPIRPLIPVDYKIPHIGWNGLSFPRGREKCPIFRDTAEGAHVYFVHSFYAADCEDYITATAEYGAALTAAAQNGSVYGTQFHPEKSGPAGLAILKAFTSL
jgi:glutamine amidotransferase